MIVTIDGPAGAGKSSAAKALAQRLGFDFLDTGAMYRAVTLAGIETNCDLSDDGAVSDFLGKISIEMHPNRILLNGRDVSTQIRRPEVTEASGKVANCPMVRNYLLRLQREIAATGDFVTEGRDQGTIVFPDAACKFFLTADPHERAKRRFAELRAKGETVTLDEILTAQQARDQRDTNRKIAPLVAADDAHHIDSTGLRLVQVVDRMEQQVRQCQIG